MTDKDTSYFVNVDAIASGACILSGDRNLQVKSQPVQPGLFELTTNLDMGWTHELHLRGGYLAFADGHVEWFQTNQLNAAIKRQPFATNHLAVP